MGLPAFSALLPWKKRSIRSVLVCVQKGNSRSDLSARSPGAAAYSRNGSAGSPLLAWSSHMDSPLEQRSAAPVRRSWDLASAIADSLCESPLDSHPVRSAATAVCAKLARGNPLHNARPDAPGRDHVRPKQSPRQPRDRSLAAKPASARGKIHRSKPARALPGSEDRFQLWEFGFAAERM